MPFTFSHPAIFLLLKKLPKKWFSLTGLIIGSIVPDFEYFLQMRISSVHSHTSLGVFWYNLPLAVILTFIFHLAVRNQLINNLPIYFRNRLTIYLNFDWNQFAKRHWLKIIISILIGIYSHLFWDSFTHFDGFFVHKTAFLSQKVSFWGFKIPIFKILQHSSSIVGAVLIAKFFHHLPMCSNNETKIKMPFWVLLIALTTIIFSFRFVLMPELNQLGNLIVSMISSFLFSLILASLIFNKIVH